MKRSTGGLVLLERTSVKEGSRFLRLLAQSSCCLFSSSMAKRDEGMDARRGGRRTGGLLVVGDGNKRGCQTDLLKPWVVTADVSEFSRASSFRWSPRPPINLLHHEFREDVLTSSTGNPYSVLADRPGVGGD